MMLGNSATLEKRKVLSNYSLIIVEIYLKYDRTRISKRDMGHQGNHS